MINQRRLDMTHLEDFEPYEILGYSESFADIWEAYVCEEIEAINRELKEAGN